MFRTIPMYETNAIQLHFLVQLFWYLSQWSGSICSIFCTRLYSKDIHCVKRQNHEKSNVSPAPIFIKLEFVLNQKSIVKVHLCLSNVSKATFLVMLFLQNTYTVETGTAFDYE